jgi:TPR repeat protein
VGVELAQHNAAHLIDTNRQLLANIPGLFPSGPDAVALAMYQQSADQGVTSSVLALADFHFTGRGMSLILLLYYSMHACCA